MNKDTAKGHAHEALGKGQQAVGKAMGSDKLVAKGLANEGRGAAEKLTGKAKSAAKKALS